MSFWLQERYTRVSEKTLYRLPASSLCPGTDCQSTRCQLLNNLTLDIQESEQRVAILLRAFDLEAHVEEQLEPQSCDYSSSEIFPPNVAPTARKNGSPPHPLTTENHIARSPDNSFLSTPLRLKHFSRLSPSILRDLLRSPSLRMPTPDCSFMEETSDLFVTGGNSVIESRPGLKPVHSTYANGLDRCSYPLTPPSTAHPPAVNQFLSPEQEYSNVDDSNRAKIYPAPYPASQQSISPERSPPSNLFAENNLCTSNPAEPLNPLRAHRSIYKRPPTETLLSPAVLQNFQLVVNELRGREADPDKRKRNLLSSLRMSMCIPSSVSVTAPVSLPASILPTPNPEPHNMAPHSSCSSSGLPFCEIAVQPQFPFTSPDQDSNNNQPPTNSPGTLDVEFMTLLIQQAAQEEAEADELRVLVGRLERLAKGRRDLAKLVGRTAV